MIVDGKNLAPETIMFTIRGKPRIYPANIMKKCIWRDCDRHFMTHLPTGKFCSDACRSKYWRELNKQRDRAKWAETRRRADQPRQGIRVNGQSI